MGLNNSSIYKLYKWIDNNQQDNGLALLQEKDGDCSLHIICYLYDRVVGKTIRQIMKDIGLLFHGGQTEDNKITHIAANSRKVQIQDRILL